MKLYDKDIVYLDRQIVIALKPYGVLSQKDPRENLEDLLQEYLRTYLQKSGNVFCKPAHRLDKNVGGLVVFARTSKALARLQKAFREKNHLEKIYYAKVEGKLTKGARLVHYLVKTSYRSLVYTKPRSQGKEAILTFDVIKTGEESIVKISLETGRYHQIRAQMAFIGHPICGDQKYGAKRQKKDLDLYHAEITLPHPISQEMMTFRAKVPFIEK